MNFFSKKPKINIKTEDFYIFALLIIFMTMVNAILFGLSMHSKNLIDDVIKYNSTYSEIKLKLIINYLAFSAILIIFIIHTFLAKNHIKVGYLYTNIWNLLLVTIVAVPIITQPNWTNPKIYINLSFYIIFMIAMFRVYKQIYEARQLTGYWTKNNGGSIPW